MLSLCLPDHAAAHSIILLSPDWPHFVTPPKLNVYSLNVDWRNAYITIHLMALGASKLLVMKHLLPLVSLTCSCKWQNFRPRLCGWICRCSEYLNYYFTRKSERTPSLDITPFPILRFCLNFWGNWKQVQLTEFAVEVRGRPGILQTSPSVQSPSHSQIHVVRTQEYCGASMNVGEWKSI